MYNIYIYIYYIYIYIYTYIYIYNIYCTYKALISFPIMVAHTTRLSQIKKKQTIFGITFRYSPSSDASS